MLFSKYSNTATILTFLASTLLVEGKKPFTLHHIDSRSSFKSGPDVGSSTYHKFDQRVPKNIKSTAAINRGTVVASLSEQDGEYLTTITIGGQVLNVVIDTGSSFLWTFSSDFVSVLSTYNSSISNTSRLQEGITFEGCYGSGYCIAGDVYTETIGIGGVIVNNQTIGAARAVSSKFDQTNRFDGILGLGFDDSIEGIPQYTPFIDSIKSIVPAPLSTADLKNEKPGSYDFGFIDNSKYTGDIIYVPVDTSQKLWGCTLNGYGVGTDSFNPININVVVDTGTTIIYLPETIVAKYYVAVWGAVHNSTVSGYIYPCSTALPSITFGIGSYHAIVPGHYLEATTLREDNTTCYGAIQPGKPETFVLGQAFLKSQFVVFDVGDKPRLGFAAKPW